MATYNNAGTLGPVIENALASLPDVVVVNDGSTDNTNEVLARYPHANIVRFPRNRGKGAALAAGMRRAWELGFTHTISMDTDGQHFSNDIPKFLAKMKSHPNSFIIGDRQIKMTGKRQKRSIYCRLNANWWTWVGTGVWPKDALSGFRVYPLQKLVTIQYLATRYDFEAEILIKGMWMGLGVECVPVRVEYGPGSESNFRDGLDTVLLTRTFWLNDWKRALLPLEFRRFVVQRRYIQRSFGTRIAGALGDLATKARSEKAFVNGASIGAMIALLPLYGFNRGLATNIARRFRADGHTARVFASFSGNTIQFTLMVYLVMVAGHLVGTGNLSWNIGEVFSTGAGLAGFALRYLIGAVALIIPVFLIARIFATMVARFASGSR